MKIDLLVNGERRSVDMPPLSRLLDALALNNAELSGIGERRPLQFRCAAFSSQFLKLLERELAAVNLVAQLRNPPLRFYPFGFRHVRLGCLKAINLRSPVP